MQFENFKKTINKFATGVTVVTGYYNNTPLGLTVNSFTSLSLDPTLILFNLDKKTASISSFLNTSYFNVNILSNKQTEVASVFATKNIDKFAKVNYQNSRHNIPILSGVHALLECKKNKVIEAGDHYIFICDVIKSSTDNSKSPLVYYNSNFYSKL